MVEIRNAEYTLDFKHIVQAQLDMALESEGLSLDRETVESGVKRVFDDPAKGVYRVATIDGEFAGCLLNTYEWSDWRNATCLWIQSVFVPKKHRRKGVFNSFYSFLKRIVEEDSQYCGLRLYVDKTNQRAQKVYDAMGMSKEHYELYEWLKL